LQHARKMGYHKVAGIGAGMSLYEPSFVNLLVDL